MIDSLDVMLWDKKVGTLVATQDKYRSKVCFYFDQDFVKTGYDIAPLQAPISGVPAQRGLPVYPEEDKMFGGLPSFIADSLPDHWGNTVFNEWAKVHHIRTRDLSPLDRLAYIGRRGMGALEFVPPTAREMEAPFKVEIAELYKLAQRALSEAKGFNSAIKSDFVIESLFKVGTSAGGRRPKAVVNVNFDDNQFYSGQVPTPLPGYIPMIIKFDEHLDIPTTRVEYSYYLMAKDAGLEMMPCRLLEGEKETHFLTERFDRRGNEKVHIQTLAALNPTANSYEEVFETACRIGVSSAELRLLFYSTVMNVLGGNVDDHNKNFSFLMGQDGQWHFAPVYDYTFTVDPSAPHYVNRHSMMINGKVQDITREDLLGLARRYNIKSATSYIEKDVGIVGNYQTYGEKPGVGGYWIHVIKEELASRIENISDEWGQSHAFKR